MTSFVWVALRCALRLIRRDERLHQIEREHAELLVDDTRLSNLLHVLLDKPAEESTALGLFLDIE